MNKILFLISLIIFFCSNAILGQNDTIINQDTNQINAGIKQKLQYLDENLREEKNLFKLFAYPVIVSTEKRKYAGFGNILAYERKLGPSFSVMYSNQATFYIFNSTDSAYQQNYESTNFYISGNLDFRYYYSMKKRIRQQISANNFHSNYIALVLDDFYYIDYYYFLNRDNGTPYELNYSTFLKPKIQLMWGMQRRISNWAYFDLAPYISYDPFHPYFSYGIKLQLGLAWGK